MKNISSRDRLLTTLNFGEPDHPPCCFSAFLALQRRCAGPEDFVLRQIEMGLDVAVKINDPPISFHPDVEVREWKQEPDGVGDPSRYPILHCDYHTPAGTLSRSVKQTEDWPDGDHVPFLSDHTIPRATKHLITGESDLDALQYLLRPPAASEIQEYRRGAQAARSLADAHDLIVTAGTSQHADFACWLSGIQDLTLLTLDSPDFVRAYLAMIEEWNRERMAVMLDDGIDVLVRRGWYENADFWPPELFREFLLPALKRDVEQVHAAGARLAYTMSCSSMPLIETLIEAGVDALMGVDPAQDRMMDLDEIKSRTAGRMTLWGGVCGYLTVERGEEEDVRREVRDSLSILAPGGGFILAPVTNVRSDTERAWRNVEAMIDEWKRSCES